MDSILMIGLALLGMLAFVLTALVCVSLHVKRNNHCAGGSQNTHGGFGGGGE